MLSTFIETYLEQDFSSLDIEEKREMLIEIGNAFDETRPGLISEKHLQDLASILVKIRSAIRGKHPFSEKGIEKINEIVEDVEVLSIIEPENRSPENIKTVNNLSYRLLTLADVLRTASFSLTFKILLDQVS